MPLPLMIILAVLGGILLLTLLLLFFGSARIHIICCEKLKVVAWICGVPITLFSNESKAKKKKSKKLPRCRNPEAALKKELRRRASEEKKAERKRKRAEKKAAKKKAKQATDSSHIAMSSFYEPYKNAAPACAGRRSRAIKPCSAGRPRKPPGSG